MSTAYRRASETCWCIINGEGFLRSRVSGTSLAMNAPATLIWCWLSAGRTTEEIERALAGAFTDASELSRDIGAFISELTEHDLICSTPEAPPAEPIDPRPEPGCGYTRPRLQPLSGGRARFAFA